MDLGDEEEVHLELKDWRDVAGRRGDGVRRRAGRGEGGGGSVFGGYGGFGSAVLRLADAVEEALHFGGFGWGGG